MIAMAACASAQEIKVTLLGTGSPLPRMDRFGPSILVEAGKETLLFDCGRGAAHRLDTRTEIAAPSLGATGHEEYDDAPGPGL